MNKKLRTMKVSILMFILLSSTLGTFLIITPKPASAKLITYDSVLQITYNAADLNNAVFSPSGQPVSIPINVSFNVNVPPLFMSNIVLRLIFLQSFIITNARIQLSIENPPDSAAISIANPDVYVDISTTPKSAQSAIIITPHANAPAEGFNLIIKGVTDPLLNGHVPAKTAEANLQFQPGYTPYVNVYTDNPSVIVGPQETVTFPFKVTNLGNQQTQVSIIVINAPEGWKTLISDNSILIPSADQAGAGNNVGSMSLSVTPPYGFGWHNDVETIQVEFIPSFYPPTVGKNQTGNPIIKEINVRSRGFSTPGFELVGLLAALIIVAILIKKQRK